MNINKRERQQDKVIRHPRPRGCSYVSGNSSILILRVPRHEYKRSFVTKEPKPKTLKEEAQNVAVLLAVELIAKAKGLAKVMETSESVGFLL